MFGVPYCLKFKKSCVRLQNSKTAVLHNLGNLNLNIFLLGGEKDTTDLSLCMTLVCNNLFLWNKTNI